MTREELRGKIAVLIAAEVHNKGAITFLETAEAILALAGKAAMEVVEEGLNGMFFRTARETTTAALRELFGLGESE